jgi:hypothetical protein
VGKLMTVAHRRGEIALTAIIGGVPSLCLVTSEEPRCLKNTENLTNSRVAFGADDQALYYSSRDGLARVGDDDQHHELLVKGAEPFGGIAVAPDGKALVYSSCDARGQLLDAGAVPPAALTPMGAFSNPGSAPDGSVAYAMRVGAGYALMLRSPDGKTRQLEGPFAGRVTQPRFSRDGQHLAFFVAGQGLLVSTLSASTTLAPTPVAKGDSDEDPAWLPDGRLLFTRRGGATPGAQIIDPRGGEPAPLEPIPRRVDGVLANGDVLMLSIDATQFVEWSLKKKREHPSAFSPASLGRVVGHAMSPNGRWLAVQAGNNAQRIYRVDLSQPKPEATLAYEIAPGQSMGNIAITDEGHVLAAPMTFAGELHVVEAAAGTRF